MIKLRIMITSLMSSMTIRIQMSKQKNLTILILKKGKMDSMMMIITAHKIKRVEAAKMRLL